jgi:type II secretory pathway component PulF
VVQQLSPAAAPRPLLPIGRHELLLFNQQLAAIAKAGIPLERSLRELAADAASPRMRRLIEAIAAELEGGTGIREAFEKHAGRLPPMYGRILEAGVRSGRLSEMLTSLNRHSETAAQTRRVLFEATAYPAVVLVLASAIFTFLLAFVVPKFGMIFRDMGRALPAATEKLLWLSNHVGAVWFQIAVLLGACVVAYIVMGRFAAGRRVRETIAFNVPVLGRLYRDTLLSRLADSLALLVGSGCDLPSSLRLAGAATGSEMAWDDCQALAARVEQGEGLTDAGARCRLLPCLLLYSMDLGAHRNELVDSLYGLSAMYHDQARAGQGRLQGLLLPVLVLMLGCLVGAAVLAMFLPMIHVLKNMQQG